MGVLTQDFARRQITIGRLRNQAGRGSGAPGDDLSGKSFRTRSFQIDPLARDRRYLWTEESFGRLGKVLCPASGRNLEYFLSRFRRFKSCAQLN